MSTNVFYFVHLENKRAFDQKSCLIKKKKGQMRHLKEFGEKSGSIFLFLFFFFGLSKGLLSFLFLFPLSHSISELGSGIFLSSIFLFLLSKSPLLFSNQRRINSDSFIQSLLFKSVSLSLIDDSRGRSLRSSVNVIRSNMSVRSRLCVLRMRRCIGRFEGRIEFSSRCFFRFEGFSSLLFFFRLFLLFFLFNFNERAFGVGRCFFLFLFLRFSAFFLFLFFLSSSFFFWRSFACFEGSDLLEIDFMILSSSFIRFSELIS